MILVASEMLLVFNTSLQVDWHACSSQPNHCSDFFERAPLCRIDCSQVLEGPAFLELFPVGSWLSHRGRFSPRPCYSPGSFPCHMSVLWVRVLLLATGGSSQFIQSDRTEVTENSVIYLDFVKLQFSWCIMIIIIFIHYFQRRNSVMDLII